MIDPIRFAVFVATESGKTDTLARAVEVPGRLMMGN